ncbi:hypothetical protein [Prauserella muralis]|uniref:Uncharacterized protein n=1 Tax=Prauserella muralis TaxID=588067 RepID=A0A2V4AZR9_9PSEU|nr:hypothetical protein [Prauserella muralis]PXY27434.1 hypothetical protein BAY60_13445 [Prauserella muralis]TWE22866.1 hypothetical protein FHX69_4122 [Prauserella muralis]
MAVMTERRFVELVEAVRSHAMRLGIFTGTAGHEPKKAPGHELFLAVWAQRIEPLPQRSGLASTAGLVTLIVRIFQGFIAQPEDGIDPRVMQAVNALFLAYSGDFDLGGRVAEVDLLGQYSPGGLFAQAGYLSQDGKNYRVMTITLPLVINDLWSQNP